MAERMKRIITVTYKNGETESYCFREIVIGEESIEIVYHAEKTPAHGGYIELNEIKEITIN